MVINMVCPYCNKEMQKGVISGDGRAPVSFNAGDKKVNMFEQLAGVGVIEAVKYVPKYVPLSFQIEAFYCKPCRKMIFDTDISL